MTGSAFALLEVDPGAHAGAALTANGAGGLHVLAWWGWHRMKGDAPRFRLADSRGDGPVNVARMYDVGAEIGAMAAGIRPFRLVIEEQFVRGGNLSSSQASVMACARAAGAIEDGIRAGAGALCIGSTLRPLCSVWAPVAGIKAGDSRAAVARAMALVKGWPRGVAPMGRGVREVDAESLGAVSEAVLMHAWAERELRATMADCPSPATPKRKAG
jgi:hypothetical protein